MSSYFKSMWEKASDITSKISNISAFNDPNIAKTNKELKEMSQKHQDQLKGLIDEINDFKNKSITEMESTVDTQKKENNKLKSDNDKLQIEILEVKNDLKIQNEKYAEFELKFGLLSKEKNYIQEDLEKKLKMIDELNTKIESLNTNLIKKEENEFKAQNSNSLKALEESLQKLNLAREAFSLDIEEKSKYLSNFLSDENLSKKLADIVNTNIQDVYSKLELASKEAEVKEDKQGEVKETEVKEGEVKEDEVKEGEVKEGENKEGEVKENEVKKDEVKEITQVEGSQSRNNKEILLELIKSEVVDKKILDSAFKLLEDRLNNENKDYFTKIEKIILELNLSEFKSKFDEDLNKIETIFESHSKISEEIKGENLKLTTSFSSLEQNLNQEKVTNERLQAEIDLIKQNEKNHIEKINEKQEEILMLIIEKNHINTIVTEKEDSIKQLETKMNNCLKEVNDLKKELEGSCETIKTKETKLREQESLIEKTKKSYEIYRESLKQILLKVLDDEFFKEIIEGCFSIKEGESINEEQFFNEIYRITTYITPKCNITMLRNILKQETLKKLISNNTENLDTLLSQLNSNLSNAQQMIDLNEKYGSNSNFVGDLIDSLILNIESHSKNSTSSSKAINENKELIKNLNATIDETKKNAADKVDTLEKQISKTKQELKDSMKTEKIQKETIETLEQSIKDSKAEVEKLNVKNKASNQSVLDKTKEIDSIREKLIASNQKNENLRIENFELNEKIKKTEEAHNSVHEVVRRMSVEKVELSEKLYDLDKLRETIKDKEKTIVSKKNEIELLKTSCKNLEELISNMKIIEDKNTEVYRSQIIELTEKAEEFEKKYNLAEEKSLEQNDNDKALSDLKEALYLLDQENIKLKEQRDNIKKHAEEIVVKVRKDLQDTEYLIDKRIISDFLFKYFDKTKNDKIKQSLLDYFSNLMGYNNDERKQIGLPPRDYSISTTTSTSSTNDKLKDLSDDLYNFVMNA